MEEHVIGIILYFGSGILSLLICTFMAIFFEDDAITLGQIIAGISLNLAFGPFALLAIVIFGVIHFFETYGDVEVVKSKENRLKAKKEKVEQKERKVLLKDLEGGLSVKEFNNVKDVLGE